MDIRSNVLLSQNEKQNKLYYKRLLKDQHILYKYSTRYQQAIRRNDIHYAIYTLQNHIQVYEQKIITEYNNNNTYNNNNYKQHDDCYDNNNETSTTATATAISQQEQEPTRTNIHYSHILNDPFITQNYIHRNIVTQYMKEQHEKMDRMNANNTLNDETMIQLQQQCDETIVLPPLPPRKNHTERQYLERLYQQLQQILYPNFNGDKKNIKTGSSRTTTNGNDVVKKEWNVNTCSLESLCISEDREDNVIEENDEEQNSNTVVVHATPKNQLAQQRQHMNRYTAARQLLQNMTKGVQQIQEFDNYDALLGYTKHKFIERAMLVVSSINQLLIVPTKATARIETTNENPTKKTHCSCIYHDTIDYSKWIQRIVAIRSITSIGCGPGCDMVGMITVLLHHLQRQQQQQQQNSQQEVDSTRNNNGERNISLINDNSSVLDNSHRDSQNNNVVLDRIVLLDWAITQWYPILKSVVQLLIEKDGMIISPTSTNIIYETCDVRCSVQQQTFSMNNENNHWLYDTDIVVISYLFSETRDKWYHFLDDYIRQYCKVGTLFLITDPTAWQLHIFRERYEYYHDPNSTSKSDGSGNTHTDPISSSRKDETTERSVYMEFVWLDSSMYRPELQQLEGRNGPGVLLAMKVAQ